MPLHAARASCILTGMAPDGRPLDGPLGFRCSGCGLHRPIAQTNDARIVGFAREPMGGVRYRVSVPCNRCGTWDVHYASVNDLSRAEQLRVPGIEVPPQGARWVRRR